MTGAQNGMSGAIFSDNSNITLEDSSINNSSAKKFVAPLFSKKIFLHFKSCFFARGFVKDEALSTFREKLLRFLPQEINYWESSVGIRLTEPLYY